MSDLQATKPGTILITDDRCLQHTGFDKYHNVAKSQQQKEEQPENAERLMVLIDKERGVLTQASEFLQSERYSVQRQAKQAALADVYRVHDYNYLMKVLQLANKLSLMDNKMLARYGKLPMS